MLKKEDYRFDLVSTNYLQSQMRTYVITRQLASDGRDIDVLFRNEYLSARTECPRKFFPCCMIRVLRQGRNLNCRYPNLVRMIFITPLITLN